MAELAVNDWSELRSEFDALGESLRFHRLDYQWGAAGTHYRLAGGQTSHATRRFEVLCEIAGRKLQELPPGTVSSDALVPTNATSRWYEVLRYESGAFEFGFTAQQSDELGNDCGNIYTGSLSLPAQSSAIVCLQFSALPSLLPSESARDATTVIGRLNLLLKSEAERRGYLWLVLAFLVTVVIALLAI